MQIFYLWKGDDQLFNKKSRWSDQNSVKEAICLVYLDGDMILSDSELTRALNRLSSGTIRLLTQKDISRIVSLKLFFVYLLYIHVNV